MTKKAPIPAGTIAEGSSEGDRVRDLLLALRSDILPMFAGIG